MFGKKRNWKKSSEREKKSKWFGVEILLSSCSLVGLYVNLQAKFTGKNDEDFQSIFQVNVLKLKVWFAEKDKVKENVGFRMYRSWASCCETWLKLEVKVLRWRGKKKKVKVKKMFFGSGFCALHTLGRHVVNEPKVRCPVMMGSKYCKSDFRWIIHLRLYSGPSRL